MRAVTQASFGGPEQLKIDSIDKPIPAAGQVLVRVIATSVNRPDIIQRQGNYPPPPGDSEVLGLEIAGEVAEVGSGVLRWKVGDRVMGLVGGGGYAEFATAWAHHLMTVPETLTWAQAASVSETYITAHLNIFQCPGLLDGQSALLHGGGGGVNIAAIQLCQALVPGSALFVTCSPMKVDRVKALGEIHVIDYQNEDFAEILKEVTKGHGVDLILDHIGAAYLERNLKSLSIGGSLVLIGVMGGVKSEINLAQIMVRRQKICGSVLRPRSVEEKARITQNFYQQALPHFLNGNLSPVVDQVFLLEDVRKAHELMDASGHFGKIVLQVDASISIV